MNMGRPPFLLRSFGIGLIISYSWLHPIIPINCGFFMGGTYEPIPKLMFVVET